MESGTARVRRSRKLLAIAVPFIMLLSLLLLPHSSGLAAPRATESAPLAAKDPTDLPKPIVEDPARGATPADRIKPQTVTVNLIAQEVEAELVPANPTTGAPAKKFFFWTFNGTVPGPMIRVMEGDTVVINLTNPLTNGDPHNIDLHAVMGPGGGAAVTNVMPGETATLRFKAMRSGSYIYHCAGEGMPWEHVAHGMYGMILVEPKGGLPTGFKEFYVGQSDWYLTSAPIDPVTNLYDLDQEKAAAEHPDYFSFNGNTQALTSPAIFGDKMHVMQNDKVRIFFVTGGPNIGSNFHVIGQIFDKVYTGKTSNISAVMDEETVYVAPGSAAIFEMVAKVPGTYLLVDHALYRVPKGAAGHLHVDYITPPSPANPNGSWPLDLYSPLATGTGH